MNDLTRAVVNLYDAFLNIKSVYEKDIYNNEYEQTRKNEKNFLEQF